MNKRDRLCFKAILLIVKRQYKYHYDMERKEGIWRKELFEDAFRVAKCGGK